MIVDPLVVNFSCPPSEVLRGNAELIEALRWNPFVGATETNPSASTCGFDCLSKFRTSPELWPFFPILRRALLELLLRADARSSFATSLWISAIVFAVSSFRRVTQPLDFISSKSWSMNLILLLTFGPSSGRFPAMISTVFQQAAKLSAASTLPTLFIASLCCSRLDPMTVMSFAKHSIFSSSTSSDISPVLDASPMRSCGRQKSIILILIISPLYNSPINRMWPR
mmetsp:Transcript_18101/g.39094  ORF Transcript_18101/g.39094 Transcript_18101/m.39094 type:complete len:226 (+) Transcript_18101:788-1465(+)